MKLKVGIDVGGTFTDFLVTRPNEEPQVYKVLSTPSDPSIGLIEGLKEIAVSMGLSLNELAQSIETVVHGTTVTTNAILTLTGAKTGLLTTHGVRDALEMRRGIREEQYNNRYTNVPPLVPRYLRMPVRERLNYRGDTQEPLNTEDIRQALRLFKQELLGKFPDFTEEQAELLCPQSYATGISKSHKLPPLLKWRHIAYLVIIILGIYLVLDRVIIWNYLTAPLQDVSTTASNVLKMGNLP